MLNISYIYPRSTSIIASSWIQTNTRRREREKERKVRKMKRGKWGISVTRHIDRTDSLLFIASVKCFSSFVVTCRRNANESTTDTKSSSVMFRSAWDNRPKKKSGPVTIFMNRRTAEKDSCTSWHCSDFSLGIVKTKKKQHDRISTFEIVRDIKAEFYHYKTLIVYYGHIYRVWSKGTSNIYDDF